MKFSSEIEFSETPVFFFGGGFYNVQMDGRFGGQIAGGRPKGSPRPRQPLFAVPAKVLAGLAFCEMQRQYPRSSFQRFCWGHERLRVKLLGIEGWGILKVKIGALKRALKRD